MFEILKVFDCQKMPDDVRSWFFEHTETGNDCAINWHVEPDEGDYDEDTETWSNQKYNPVTIWLMQNGATEGEKVLIYHWW